MNLESQIPPHKQYAADIAALKLQYGSPSNKKVIILVEGTDDARFYKHFFDTQHSFIKAMKGKIFVEQALNDLKLRIPNIIGIRDADFLHLEQKTSPLPNLFLTDVHDLELMLLHSDSVFQKLVNEYNLSVTLRKQILDTVAFLAYFRWYNEKNDWYNENNEPIGFTFTGLKLNKFYKNSQLNERDLVEQIKAQSHKALLIDIDEIISGINELQDDTHNLWQLCNGHDYIKILAAEITLNNKGINDEDLTQILRMTYHITDFKQTHLYKNMQTWATQNHCILYKT